MKMMMTKSEMFIKELSERLNNIYAFAGNNIELERAEIKTAKAILSDLSAEVKGGRLHVGDVVIHVKHPNMKRRIRKIEDGMLLLSGFYEYVNAYEVRKVEGAED